eukprot:TRINITY_DN12251_c0_g1_i1.p1 TRINITY_DN12251_c0_g1~~TRINITY_DN12251_c0_g1_i1.p1  ORF type:complete len:106 (+),score=23.98 TRINITY_DN12251_c0_g1_i1:232-549(+)
MDKMDGNMDGRISEVEFVGYFSETLSQDKTTFQNECDAFRKASSEAKGPSASLLSAMPLGKSSSSAGKTKPSPTKSAGAKKQTDGAKDSLPADCLLYTSPSPRDS